MNIARPPTLRRSRPAGAPGVTLYNRCMRVALGADHAGVTLKDLVRHALDPNAGGGAGGSTPDVVDLGVHSADPADYPDVAHEVAAGVASGAYDRGILICGSGVGMSIAANKVPGIRAALVHSVESARLCREHNDANILALAGRSLADADALAIIEAFLETPFAGGRHRRRVEKIAAIERRHTP